MGTGKRSNKYRGDKTGGLTVDEIRGTLQDAGATAEDLDRFDEVVSRRRFFGLIGRSGAAAALLAGAGAGSEAMMQGLFGRGMIPAAWAEPADAEIPGKPDMTIHNARPVNGEFAPHLLDDPVTPSSRHFVRNNGLVPERAKKQNLQGWSLTIDGEVHQPLKLTFDQLESMRQETYRFVVECGGNGRALFDPPVRGNPWGRGAVACSEWTGVLLRDVLKEAGLKDTAVYTAHYGEDPPLKADSPPFSRGVPVDKAMMDYTMIALKMNGQPIPALHGYPVRLIIPGWIGSASQKWLNRIWIRDKVHDSKKMSGYAYRIPRYPVKPGTKPPKEDMVIATAWHIKSLITHPAEGASLRVGQTVEVRGHAWAGEDRVKKVFISTDYGVSWEKARLIKPRNRYAWYDFRASLGFDRKGYYEIWARAFDDQGQAQPFRQPWNPKGYLGNVIHRVPVLVGV